ncbi:MAG: acyl-homoserine-lactone synthase [Pseudomonadota bacterium]
MNIVTGTPADLSSEIMAGVARYRHRVFVEKLGWQLQCENALEYDQFDRDDTVYVVAHNKGGEVVGTARLLPTTRPYLLDEVFPQLLHGVTPPHSPDVWELSRFAAVDFSANNSSALAQFSSPIAVGLLQASLECAARHGAKRFITVSPLGVERLLRIAGFRAHRLAPPTIMDGNPVFACSISCETQAALASADRPYPFAMQA